MLPQVSVTDDWTGVVDQYSLNVGIRTISWTERSFLINNKPFYLRGVAEPIAETRANRRFYCGKDAANCTIKMFANSILRKFASQPLTEEMIEIADQLGVVVILQAPAIALRWVLLIIVIRFHIHSFFRLCHHIMDAAREVSSCIKCP